MYTSAQANTTTQKHVRFRQGATFCWRTWPESGVECTTCQAERESKHLVMNETDEKRHRQREFLRAPAIFPNSDIKFEVNIERAQIYAAAQRESITWSIAKDKPCNKVIAEPGRREESVVDKA